MLKHNKRGLVTAVVISLIIMVVSAIIMFSLFVVWKDKTEVEIKRSICQWSALIKDKINYKVVEFIGVNYELKCEPVNIAVSKEKSKDIGKIVSNEMFKCWNTLGRGELDVISSWKWKKEVACVVCSKIEPKEEEIRMKLDELDGALKNLAVEDENKAFVNYFKTEDKGLNLNLKGNDEFVITKQKPLYVVYSFYKLRPEFNKEGISFGKKEAVGSGAVLGCAVIGGIFGSLPGAVIGGGICGAGGVASYFAFYRSDLRQGFWIASGDELINRCDALK